MPLNLIPRTPYPHTINEIIKALLGNRPEEFLVNLLKVLNLTEGILTGSGREALFYILKTLLNKDDEIILPAFSCNVLLGAIKKAGVVPVFADVNCDSLNMGLSHIEPLANDKTKAVLVTHQFGYPADVDVIVDYCRFRNILVIEDAAPALGATYKGRQVGSFGDVGFFSFQQSKVISTIDGGLIFGQTELINKMMTELTPGPAHASIKYFVSALRTYSIKNEYIYFVLLNLWRMLNKPHTVADNLVWDFELYSETYKRLSKFQMNLGNQQLSLLPQILETRKQAATLYRDCLADCQAVIKIPQSDLSQRDHTYSRFPILVHDKDLFYNRVRQFGVDLGFTFSYKLPQYLSEYRQPVTYNNTDFIINHILNIPIHRKMSVNQLIIKRIQQALNSLK